MLGQTQVRFRSDLIVKRAGRFRFDGYVDSGWRPSPHPDEMFVDLAVGQPFPRVHDECWWVPLEKALVEFIAEQQMIWEGGPAAR